MKCQTCGQEQPEQVFKPGDIVEVSDEPSVLGVIPSRYVQDKIGYAGRYVTIILLSNGHHILKPKDRVTVVHGYIHIDREKGGDSYDV